MSRKRKGAVSPAPLNLRTNPVYQGTIFRKPFFFLLVDSFLGSFLRSAVGLAASLLPFCGLGAIGFCRTRFRIGVGAGRTRPGAPFWGWCSPRRGGGSRRSPPGRRPPPPPAVASRRILGGA